MLMARTNANFGTWVSKLLEIVPNDNVLEVGFGPGVVVQRLSAMTRCVAGIDTSREMVEQARARNADAIRSGGVDLRHGSVESLPFKDRSFDKAMAVNSMQVWPDALTGLREILRVLKPGGRIALGFTRHSGQPMSGLTAMLSTAGFAESRLVEASEGFCVLATKPD